MRGRSFPAYLFIFGVGGGSKSWGCCLLLLRPLQPVRVCRREQMLVRSLSRPCALCFGSLRLSPAGAALRRGHSGASSSGIRLVERRLRSASLGGRRPAVQDLKIRSGGQTRTRSMSGSTGSTSVVVPKLDENSEVGLLPAVDDDYEGVVVEVTTPMDPGAFVSSLRASLLVWRQQKKKGVWIKLPIQHSNLVHPAVQEGFWYHHAEPDYVMLVYWIPSAEHTLPVNATHRVGVGGLVMNDRKEVLMVQEKTGKLRGKAIWKLPTGVVAQGEDIVAGAVREVKEETGIDAEFVEVLAFRQSHKSFFDKSDLFFICLLRPISFDIKIQESELEAAQWMPIEEYAAQPFVLKHEFLKYIADIALARFEKGYAGFSPVRICSVFSDQQNYLYLNRKDLNRSLLSGKKCQDN